MKVFSFFFLAFICLMFLVSVNVRAQERFELAPQSKASFLSHEKVLSLFKRGEPERKFRPRTPQLSSRSLASIGFKNLESMHTELQTQTLNSSVDLRRYDTPIKDQIGSRCTAYSLSAAVENYLGTQNRSRNVSVAHLWSTYGIYDADAAVNAFNQNSITEAEYWPNDSNSPTGDISNHLDIRLTQFQNHQYDLQGALEALNREHAVMIAIQVPKDLGACKSTIDANSPRTKGQHALAAVGYRLDNSVAGGGYFILKNSWSDQCGDHGYHYYPFALCQRSDLYCYFNEVVAVDAR